MRYYNIYGVSTNHGFGHGTRLAYTLSAIKKKYPNVNLVINSTLPKAIFEVILKCDFEFITKPMDVGLIQFDSVHIDFNKTITSLDQLYLNEKNIINENLNLLKKYKIDLVIGDIPPLLCDVVKKAEIPSLLMGNFSWDFIYNYYALKISEFRVFVERIRESHSYCPLLLRYPFHTKMESFSNIIDIGLIPGTPTLTKKEIYDKLGIGNQLHKKIRLFVFGGMGINDIPFFKLKKIPTDQLENYHYISYQKNSSDINFIKNVSDITIRPLDILPYCERVITKPGHGILTDVYSLRVPIVCLKKQEFPEVPVLIESVENYFENLIIDDNSLCNSNWEFIFQKLNTPRVISPEFDCNGHNSVIDLIEKESWFI